MSKSTPITNTIFKSNKISFETTKDDYRSVKAVKEINIGEILLIEHCYASNNFNHLSNVVIYSQELFNNLYPRKMLWDEETIINNIPDEIIDLCAEKIQKNCFKRDGKYAIGLDISNFNHSISANATATCVDVNVEQIVCCFISYVYAHKFINIGEEINIYYNKNIYFGDGDTIETANVDVEFKLSNHYINKIVLQYVKKDICKHIVLKHICIYYGLYITNDTIFYSKKLQEYFTKTIKKECNHQNIKIWLIQMEENLNNTADYIERLY